MRCSVTISVLLESKIDIGVVTAFAWRARADDEKHGVAVGAVQKMMAVGNTGLEARGVPRLQPHEVDAELAQARRRTQRLPFAAIDNSSERFRIRRSTARRQCTQVDP